MTSKEQSLPPDSARATTVFVFQAVTLGTSLAAGVIIARLFGPHGRGIYALALLPGQVLSALAAAGVGEATIYFVSGRHAPRARVLRFLVTFQFVASAVILAMLGLLWLFLGVIVKGVPRDAFILAAAASSAYLWMALAQSYLFAIGKTASSQWPFLTERIATLAGLIWVLVASADVTAAVAATAAGAYAGGLASIALVGGREMKGIFGRSDAEPLARRMLRYAGPLALAGIAQRLTYRLDQLIVNVIAGPTVVGLYGLSARVAELPLLIPRSLRSAWSASRAREVSLNRSVPGTLAGSRKLTILMMFAMPPYVLAGSLAIPLVYGHAFAGSVAPFAILVGATFALALSYPFVSALTGGGRPGRLTAASWLGLITTVGLDFALVPSFGAVGAALASLGAYSMFAVVTFALWRRACRVPISLRALVPRREDGAAVVVILRERLSSRRRKLLPAVDSYRQSGI